MKASIFFWSLILALQAVIPTVYAQKSVLVYDSLHIPEEEIMDFVKVNQDDIVIKLYKQDMFAYICEDQTTAVRDRLQADLNTFPQRLFSVSVEALKQDQPTPHTDMLHFFLQAIIYPERVFETANLSNGLEIWETYAFEPYTYGESFIYYITNQGSYVYYTPCLAAVGFSVNAYLIPEEVIREAYPKHVNHVRLFHSLDNGGPRIEDSYDLSAYCVRGFEKVAVHQHDPSKLNDAPKRAPFFPTAAVVAAGICAVFIGGIAIGGLVYHKRKKR